MKKAILTVLIVAGVAALTPVGTNAQTAMERAAALKTWRAQCSEPDPDLQLGYLEEAITLNDESILRICLRQTLNSDNADTLNLALRTAIASKKRLIFETSLPPELAKAYQGVGRDKKKKEEIDDSYIAQLYSYIANGLAFEIRDAELGSNRSLWLSIAKNSEPDDRFSGQAYAVGSKVTWTGSIWVGSTYTCDLATRIVPGSRLEGTLNCDRLWPVPVTAPLL